MKKKIRVSVGELVAFCCRTGDLELASISAGRSVDPLRIHQKIQKSRPPVYESEVVVARTVEHESFTMELGGRIDGVYTFPDRIIIDEIKTTSDEFEALRRSPNLLHWAQAKCYGALYGAAQHCSSLEIQLTYYQIDSKVIMELRESYTLAELESFFSDCTTRYGAWMEQYLAYLQRRNESILKMEFPYRHFRTGQRAMAAAVYRAVRDGRKQFIQAPTGIGKTVAALFPAIKALGEERVEKLFYVTARTTGKESAEKAIAALLKTGLTLKSLTLTAKEKICFYPDASCTASECPCAKGHYDRLPQALAEAFAVDTLDRAAVERIARNHQVCPFEFSLDISLLVDCIIGDYNYVFDPRVCLRRFFENREGKYAFLIDEAHNLVDRSREMFSAELEQNDVRGLRTLVREKNRPLYTLLGSINKRLVAKSKECDVHEGSFAVHEPDLELGELLKKFTFKAQKILASKTRPDYRESLMELFFSTTVFVSVLDQYDNSYMSCYEKIGKSLRCTLFCIDPSRQMEAALTRCTSALFFSATLAPVAYFRKILGCDEHATSLTLRSPFPQEHLKVCVAGGISTRYKDRVQTKPLVARMLASLIHARRGNYLFYFPSYEYLQMVHTEFAAIADSCEIVVQKQDFTELDREQFLSNFRAENPKSLAGFAVMGGVFGEGIDLIGDRLSGVAIVGPGLPGIGQKRELIRDYFEQQGKGFEYAYQYPGINKVLQAAGRVIRSETDRGVVLLIDERFTQQSYKSLFPLEWKPQRTDNPEQLDKILHVFWNENES